MLRRGGISRVGSIGRPRRQRALSLVMVVVGLILLALPRAQEGLGQWRQYVRATRVDSETLAYRNALVATYDRLARDFGDAGGTFEDRVVAFEVGAQPTPSPPPVGHSSNGSDEAPSARAKTLARPEPSGLDVNEGLRIRIPKIALDQVVVEGVSRSALRNGPGHYPGTPMPGGRGNAVISGHRTTYTKPFGDLDRLAPGDPIEIISPRRTILYEVHRVVVVETADVAMLADSGEPLLTLTTCHPKGSARQRLVVQARLVPV